jgi:hypothetical protein
MVWGSSTPPPEAAPSPLDDHALGGGTAIPYDSGLLGCLEDPGVCVETALCCPCQVAKTEAMLATRPVAAADVLACPCLHAYATRRRLRAQLGVGVGPPWRDLLLLGPLCLLPCAPCAMCAVCQDARQAKDHFARMGITWDRSGAVMTVAPRARRMVARGATGF